MERLERFAPPPAKNWVGNEDGEIGDGVIIEILCHKYIEYKKT